MKAIGVLFLLLFSVGALAESELPRCYTGESPLDPTREIVPSEEDIWVADREIKTICTSAANPNGFRGRIVPGDLVVYNKTTSMSKWIYRCGNGILRPFTIPRDPQQVAQAKPAPQLVFYDMGTPATTAQAGLNVNLRNANSNAAGVAAAGVSSAGFAYGRIKAMEKWATGYERGQAARRPDRQVINTSAAVDTAGTVGDIITEGGNAQTGDITQNGGDTTFNDGDVNVSNDTDVTNNVEGGSATGVAGDVQGGAGGAGGSANVGDITNTNTADANATGGDVIFPSEDDDDPPPDGNPDDPPGGGGPKDPPG